MRHCYRTTGSYAGIDTAVEVEICYVFIDKPADAFCTEYVSKGYSLTIKDLLLDENKQEIYSNIADANLPPENPYHKDIASLEASLAEYGIKLTEEILARIAGDTDSSLDSLDDHGTSPEALDLIREGKKHKRPEVSAIDTSDYARNERMALLISGMSFEEALKLYGEGDDPSL